MYLCSTGITTKPTMQCKNGGWREKMQAWINYEAFSTDEFSRRLKELRRRANRARLSSYHALHFIRRKAMRCVGFYSSEQIQSSGLLLLVLSGSFGTSMCPLCCLKQNSPDPRGCMLSSLIEEAWCTSYPAGHRERALYWRKSELQYCSSIDSYCDEVTKTDALSMKERAGGSGNKMHPIVHK